jgi:DNA-binding beta-propeller fold protein YncE
LHNHSALCVGLVALRWTLRLKQRLRCVFFFDVLFLIISFCSCGGGGSSTTGTNQPPPSPPPPGDFSLVIQIASVSLQQQGAYQFEGVSAQALNGFTGTINVSVSGLPQGVSTVPVTIPSFSPNGVVSSTAFQLAASQSAALGTSAVVVTGSSGAITHSATFSLSVTAAAPFAIQLSPASLSITPATSTKVKVTVAANSGTSPQLLVNINPPYSLPNGGVTIGAPQGLLSPGNPVRFGIQAAVSAQPIQNFPIVVTATDNSNNSSVTVLPLTVSVPFSSSNSLTRSTFARTDQGPTGTVYDQVRKLLFVSVETLSEVAVFSSIDGHRVATIPVMYPAGIDESADGSAVYVVSPFSPLITTIDPNLLQVIGQTVIPKQQCGLEVSTLATGDVMVLIATNATGPAPVYVWSPMANSFKNIGQFSAVMRRSLDRSKVLFYDVSSTGAMATLYDVATATVLAQGNLNGVYQIAISPDGSNLVGLALQGSPTVLLDDTFSVIASASLSLFPISDVVFSLDGTQIYALGVDAFMGNVAVVLDTQTFSMVGLTPGFNFGTSLPFSGQWLAPLAVDETNMLFGAANRGMEYLDVSSPGLINLPISGIASVQPTSLSLTAPTTVQISGQQFSTTQNYGIYFGAPPASTLSQKGTNLSVTSNSQLTVNAPRGVTSGPANVTLTRSDGFFQVLPDWTSFGPTIVSVDDNSGTISGGDSIDIFGFGFDGSNPIVSIGGRQATVTQVSQAIPSAIFGTEKVTVVTPAGAPGDADVAVTTGTGSTTLSNGFHYLASAQIYPITGALDNIVYDQPRQRLYVSNEDHNRVEIFDLGSKTYLFPIAVGNQPTGVALTSDGALLAVVNSGDGTVSVVDLTKMQVVATWNTLAPGETTAGSQALTIAAATQHRVLVDVYYPAVIYGGAIHVLNLDTGALSCAGFTWCTNGTNVTGFSQAAMASTPDGTKVFLPT